MLDCRTVLNYVSNGVGTRECLGLLSLSPCAPATWVSSSPAGLRFFSLSFLLHTPQQLFHIRLAIYHCDKVKVRKIWSLLCAALNARRTVRVKSIFRADIPKMASATRQFARVATRTATRNASAVAPRQAFRQQGRRWYSSEPAPQKGSSTWLYLTGAAAAGGLGFWYYTASGSPSAASSKIVNPTKEDYQKVYDEIASRLEEKDDYDDGSFGPVLLRLAWHASGTFDKETGTGGSNGATMRFAPESDHGANAGLVAARNFLEPVKGKQINMFCINPVSEELVQCDSESMTRIWADLFL